VTQTAVPVRRSIGPRILPWHGTGSWRVVERNFLAYRHVWFVFLSGLLEPILYLLSIGIGVGKLVGDFELGNGQSASYVQFVAPAMLAASAMNGAIYDSTYNLFFRMKYMKLYDAMLATPLRPVHIARGEIIWALLRGAIYSLFFIVVMVALDLVRSWWMLLALPATLLIGFGFAGAGMALTTWMNSWQDFEFVQLAIVPMFLFSATFYPVSTYPDAVEVVVRCTPLYQGVVLCRDLALGTPGWECLAAVLYLTVMGSVGLFVATRRVGALLLK